MWKILRVLLILENENGTLLSNTYEIYLQSALNQQTDVMWDPIVSRIIIFILREKQCYISGGGHPELLPPSYSHEEWIESVLSGKEQLKEIKDKKELTFEQHSWPLKPNRRFTWFARDF